MIKKFLYSILVFFFLLFPFGQLGRIELPIVTLHLLDITAGVFVGTWLLSKPKFTHPLKFYFLVFWAIAGFSFLVNLTRVDQAQAIIGALYLLRLLIYILFGFAVYEIVQNQKLKNTIFWLTLVSGSISVIFGLIQYIFLPDLRALGNFGWDNHYFRAAGTFLDTGFLGIIIVFYLLSKFSVDWVGKDSKFKSRWFVYIAIFVLSATFSRASLLAFSAGLFILNIVRLKALYTLKILIFLGLLLFLLPKPGGEGVKLERSSTIYFRLQNYQESIEIFKKNPLFGQGFNFYRSQGDINPNSHSSKGADSSLLFILATMGVVGFMVFLSLVWQIINLGWSKRDNFIGLSLLTSTIAILVHSFFHNTIFYPWVLVIWFTLIALNQDTKE